MKVGETVPDFEGRTHTGDSVRFSQLVAKGPVVVFFYPKASTPGCTAQACHFRDLAAEFVEVGASRIGVSRDAVDRQRAFAERHAFDYPLVADPDGAIAKAFGAKRPGPLPSKRSTYVVGSDGRLLAEISSEIDMEVHADRALDVLREAVGS